MKRSITIVHLTSSLKIGGAEAVLCELIEHLDKNAFEHHVLYFHEGPHLERLQALGVPLYQIKGLLFRYDPIFLIRLFRLMRLIQPDCVHSLLWSANVFGRIVARLLQMPIISVLHNNVDQNGMIRNFLDRCTILLSNKIVAVSDEVAHSLLHRDSWIQATKIHIITNGIDSCSVHAKAINYQRCKSELGLLDEHYVIGSVGRFVPVKNYGLLLESFALLRAEYSHARLLLIGIGPHEQFLRKRASELRVSQNTIFIIGEQAYGYYLLFDCFVLASSKEGVSIALLEAMSLGLPCLVANSRKDHSVLTSGENGLVVEPGNSSALADGLRLLMDNRARGKMLGLAAQQTVAQKFTLETMVKAYSSLFLKLGRNVQGDAEI